MLSFKEKVIAYGVAINIILGGYKTYYSRL